MGLDINSASVEEIAELPGVGMDLAELIVEYRDERGGFSTLEALKDGPGCSEEMVERLRMEGVTAEAVGA